ncbi:methyltransferase domain-containing protein [Neofusicoccum parvum]|uniref:Methyltransferase domain-containing protein n=1 Tax=Neofusicoccum parvum TaxID=310453 RepID=A0ACB5SKA0_9PEZI|nr:methyltransferase domain-containing protein [Neofusicoccum parvum]GME56925.1 methyltransferase domain-containing protein [Neofusicoccum parvum]
MSDQFPSNVIELDPDALDGQESALGEDSQSYTTSLKSSILQYKYENGRRYHAEIKDKSYYLPNDERELDRLDLYHHVVLLRCDGNLYLAPIGKAPQRILDVGAGTGIWAIEMAEAFPSAEVIGNDLSPVQPAFVPPNVKFEIDDVEEDWLYSTPFDYIHCRFMAGSLKDWPRLMRQAFQHTKPGGWVEFQDFEMRFYTNGGEFKPGSPLDKWCDELIAGITGAGYDPEPGSKLKKWVEDAGFTNVTHKLLPIPTGTWPKDKKLKEIGAFDLVQFLEGLEAISMRTLTTLRGWSAEEVHVLLAKLREELKNPRMRLQHNMHVVYAQRPLE